MREHVPVSEATAPNRVRELREEQGLTREEFAKKAGLATRTLYSVEHGLSCRIPTMRKIVLALGMPYNRDTRIAVFLK